MRAAAAARHWLWRLVLALTGGLTVVGALPRGGCVVVANHSSHADTAALLAAVDSGHAPRVAAAADYWFARGWRSAACRVLAAAFPVRRTGGGSADIAAAAALLRTGRAVIVYPEGTRGAGGSARFHAGAFRLAAAAGVPVVPVGIAGTGDLLPRHGRLHRAHVTVRIGAPLAPDPDAARAEVTRLATTPHPSHTNFVPHTPTAVGVPAPKSVCDEPGDAAQAGAADAPLPRSRTRWSPALRVDGARRRRRGASAGSRCVSRSAHAAARSHTDLVAHTPTTIRVPAPRSMCDERERPGRWVAAVAGSGGGLALVAAWSFAEAIWWPLVPELVLFALLLAAPRAGVRLVPVAVLASMAGGLCTLALTMAGTEPAAPLVTERMRTTAAEQTAAEGAYAVRHQPLSGIPFKVYAAEAGQAGVAPLPFLAAAIGHRGVRIASVGAACALLGVLLRRWPRRYPAVVLGGYALFAVGFAAVVTAWT